MVGKSMVRLSLIINSRYDLLTSRLNFNFSGYTWLKDGAVDTPVSKTNVGRIGDSSYIGIYSPIFFFIKKIKKKTKIIIISVIPLHAHVHRVCLSVIIYHPRGMRMEPPSDIQQKPPTRTDHRKLGAGSPPVPPRKYVTDGWNLRLPSEKAYRTQLALPAHAVAAGANNWLDSGFARPNLDVPRTHWNHSVPFQGVLPLPITQHDCLGPQGQRGLGGCRSALRRLGIYITKPILRISPSL